MRETFLISLMINININVIKKKEIKIKNQRKRQVVGEKILEELNFTNLWDRLIPDITIQSLLGSTP